MVSCISTHCDDKENNVVLTVVPYMPIISLLKTKGYYNNGLATGVVSLPTVMIRRTMLC